MRPRRQATIKKPTSNIDLELSENEESDGDFSSQSSDDFHPNELEYESEKSELSEENFSADASDSENESAEERSGRKMKKASGRKSEKNKSIVGTLYRNASSKYKFKNIELKPSSQKLIDILKKAEYNKNIFGSQSVRDERKSHNFGGSAGLRLSDSSDSEQDVNMPNKVLLIEQSKDTLQMKRSTNDDAGSSLLDLKTVHDNLQKMKNEKDKFINFKSKPLDHHKANTNVAELLSIGETANQQLKRPRASQENDSDSEGWEDVEEDDTAKIENRKLKDVEIVLNNEFGNQDQCKKVKPVDVEAQIKRKFNRKRKEIQENLHKTQLICWITHGNFVNKRLNDPNLMQNALELLPKNQNQCYPKDKTDVEYFKQITKWFKSIISLRNSDMYCIKLKKRPPLMMSLAIQMKFRAAICRRDFVLIYIILLRSLGIQCRMVQSIVCDPKICPKSELMSLSNKKPQKEKDTKTDISKSKKIQKSSRTSKKAEKIPQLDGGDDQAPAEKRKSKRTIKIKGSTSQHPEESFIDLNKDENEKPNKLQGKIPLQSKKADEKFSVQPQITLNSPNRIKSASNPNTSKQSSKSVLESEKSVLRVFSPRKTRNMNRGNSPNHKISQATSSATAKKEASKKSDGKKPASSDPQKKEKPVQTNAFEKNTLQVFSPRRLRSRSRSTDKPLALKPESATKPNLKNLSRKRESTAKNEVEVKKVRVETVAKKNSKKRTASNENAKGIIIPLKIPKIPKVSCHERDSDDESLKYFKTAKPKTNDKASTSDSIDRRVLSTDEENDVKNSKGIDIWVEVYSEKDGKWVAIDVFQEKVDCVDHISKKATHPIVYVFAWSNDNSIKDVSARYCTNLNTTIRKMRVDRDYLHSILEPFVGVRTARDFKEDNELNQLQLDNPMPKSIAEFKNHPLYFLNRHLLKFQAIYPPEPPILGYVRGEAIYPRECVFTLHSRETWVKEARVVKLHEKPYKIVKTMKYDRAKNKLIRDIPLELFGIWQTQDYEPPVAENGLVPRNGYGNVELFKNSMLPVGTVHLQLPGLNKICKKLGIDCAQAVVGFDSHCGYSHPVFDGFIVCKEFEEKVVDAWNREQEELEKKERDKIEKRVYGYWKKLIKGLLIRERLKQKYNFENKH